MSGSEARKAGWLRFEQVAQFVPAGQTLYRSSAPNYKKLPTGDHDASQNLTPTSVKFLTTTGIDSIISFNKYKYKFDELAELEKVKIKYLHLRVEDFEPPTLQQLKEAVEFFLGKKSTLVHCGYGHGRTGAGVTALQIGATSGHTLDPYAGTWWGSRGNHVEKRQQISVLAELRASLSHVKIQGVPEVGPKKNFAIINFATGFYLTYSADNTTIVALSPEAVERSPRVRQEYRWAIIYDKVTKNYTLSNRVTSNSFVLTKASGAAVGDPVNNGRAFKDLNNLFTIAQLPGGDHRGLYIISPTPNPDLALSLVEPDPDNSLKKLDQSRQVPAILADTKDKFSVWIFLPILNTLSSRY